MLKLQKKSNKTWIKVRMLQREWQKRQKKSPQSLVHCFACSLLLNLVLLYNRRQIGMAIPWFKEVLLLFRTNGIPQLERIPSPSNISIHYSLMYIKALVGWVQEGRLPSFKRKVNLGKHSSSPLLAKTCYQGKYPY